MDSITTRGTTKLKKSIVAEVDKQAEDAEQPGLFILNFRVEGVALSLHKQSIREFISWLNLMRSDFLTGMLWRIRERAVTNPEFFYRSHCQQEHPE